MAIRKVVEYGDEILRKKAKLVEVVDDKIRTLLDDMVETMHKFNGVGLAGPQIGVLKRIIVIDLYDDKGPIKLVNPVLIKKEGNHILEEGCLSFPNQYAKVERPEKVIIEALNEEGKTIQIEANQILAQALMHEMDHLDGILFVDIMIPDTLEVVNPDDINTDKKI